ncbi:DUF1700 domain-containing protein [Glutamicibacter sp. AOP5-A2-18]|uniref:DUF1700 domain-containing protein n=1 Tax=Glutamicibacter sp. AOP5-A2-18 TaxID=3457656 RepID=UPI0040347BE9
MAKAAENQSVEAYLRSLDHQLRNVPIEARRELVEDIAEHIDEGRERGRSESEIIAALGTPQAVAAPYLEDVLRDGNSPRLRRIRRVLGIVALVTGLFSAIISRSSDSTIVNMAFGPVELQGLSINYDYCAKIQHCGRHCHDGCRDYLRDRAGNVFRAFDGHRLDARRCK